MGRNFRDLNAKDGMTVWTDVDVLPQPGILVHAEQTVDPFETILGQFLASVGRASRLVGSVFTIVLAVTASIGSITRSRHTSQKAQGDVTSIRTTDNVSVSENDQRSVFECSISVDAEC
jgi:hypothetical protein